MNKNNFYIYAYTRADGTPYYIGKGKNGRAFDAFNHRNLVPKDKSQIVFLNKGLTEEKAFEAEKLYISMFGRKDLGTGILRNLTNGGDGHSNPSDMTKAKMSASHKGKISWNKELRVCRGFI